MSNFGRAIELRNGETWPGRAGKPSVALTGGATRVRGQWSRSGRPVRELTDGIGDPAPHGVAFVIVLRSEFVGARRFPQRPCGHTFEHEVGGVPDVDLGYH